MNFLGKTVRGLVRPSNQDRYQIIEGKDFHIFMVADGMGGHQGGETASTMACELMENFIDKDDKIDEQVLIDAIAKVNREIWMKSQQDPKVRGMGTTLALLYLSEEKDFFINIGDSRIYGMRGNKLFQLSEDDSYVNMLIRAGEITPEEAKNHPQRAMITNAVGTSKSVTVESKVIENNYDQFLICSDGLSSVVEHEDIERMMMKDTNVEIKTEELIQEALYNGGPDNATVIIVQNRSEGDEDA